VASITGTPQFHQSPKLVITTASAIKTAPIKWLWPDVIALGMTNLFTGNPDQCKSLMIVDLIARATRGASWLNGAENTVGPVDALMMFSEDPAANVVVPRLVAAEADRERVHILHHVKTPADREREFSIAEDVKLLWKYLTEHPSIRFVAIDPFSAYFGAYKELNSDQSV